MSITIYSLLVSAQYILTCGFHGQKTLKSTHNRPYLSLQLSPNCSHQKSFTPSILQYFAWNFKYSFLTKFSFNFWNSTLTHFWRNLSTVFKKISSKFRQKCRMWNFFVDWNWVKVANRDMADFVHFLGFLAIKSTFKDTLSLNKQQIRIILTPLNK